MRHLFLIVIAVGLCVVLLAGLTIPSGDCNEARLGDVRVEKTDGITTYEVCKKITGSSLFVQDASLPTARDGVSCTWSPSTQKIYCIGGEDATHHALRDILLYDPLTSEVNVVSQLPEGRWMTSCVESSATKKIYCFAGIDGTSSTNTIYAYDPVENIVQKMNAILPSTMYATSCVESSVNKYLYCFGGSGPNGNADTIIEYRPLTDSISTRALLPLGSGDHACVDSPTTNKVFCVGGKLPFIISYDPLTNTVTQTQSRYPLRVLDLSCTLQPHTNHILCIGGWNASTIATYDMVVDYDPLADVLIESSFKILARQLLSCASGLDDVYCFGGRNSIDVRENNILTLRRETDRYGWSFLRE